jgi:hypothetical protein
VTEKTADVGMVFRWEPIFLTETHVAGLKYTAGINEIMEDVEKGSLFTPYLEVDNEYDTDAVVLVDEGERVVGHFPRPKNEIIANLIRAGKDVVCKVERIGSYNGMLEIRISVWLWDLVPEGGEPKPPADPSYARKRQIFNNKRYQYNQDEITRNRISQKHLAMCVLTGLIQFCILVRLGEGINTPCES